MMQMQTSTEVKKNKTSRVPDSRYFVPDLSPMDRKQFAKLRPRVIFVAESPHVSEIDPEKMDHRRPLCGVAGRQWWSLLSELLEENSNEDVSLERMIEFCLEHQVVVLNAVQFPLDPKVAKAYPQADPAKNLGFNKVSGQYSFKKLKNTPPVQSALVSLRERLTNPQLKKVPIHCLGNDAEWFVTQALGKEEAVVRLGDKIPHPSAWWRRGGLFGRIAREKLSQIFKGKAH